MSHTQLLSADEVAARLGISRRGLYTLLGKNEFPPPIKLGRSVRWSDGMVSEFIAAKVMEQAARN